MFSTPQTGDTTPQISFTRDFHYLTALIQHLGAHERWNSRTPRNIADSLGMDMYEVERVLASYPAFFRRSGNLSAQGEPLFMVHLRYARRRKNDETGSRESPPISAAEMGIMLDLVTKMIAVEEQNKRLSFEIKKNNLKIWSALALTFLSSVTAIATALLK
ncbi:MULTISPECIES: hypothetical protein [Escherichia]|uniref:hypothetical protein n=1 Tax=Escherichia TaxID=561 RepID=UPI000743ACD9|nr:MULTISPECIES: hypothetical protein [Escherichia]EEW0765305.1 hypothetical protein [Escherichia albertii]EEW7498971.1 hypothetical protein [Escherichia albertii]MCZ8858884.1 hypothetical protein [Escherichia albertii]MLY53534.1 hypothetical protein [Escherichia albertii]WDB86200.1 hypothetical protein PS033_24385 [Escherichia albertii]